MEHDPIKNDKRRARRERTLGADKVCSFCGCTEIEVFERIEPEVFLALVERARRGKDITLCKSHVNAVCGKSVIEEHHPRLRCNEPELTVDACGNDHARETERQRSAGLLAQSPRSLPERFASILLADAEFLESWGKKNRCWAERFIYLVKALDKHCPDWRNLDEAK